MRVKVAVVTLAALSLAGFSPPARPPMDAQQVVPKSWIPEKPTEQEKPTQPDIIVNVTPKSPSAYRHPTTVACSQVTGPIKVKKEFGESYEGARMALQDARFEEAIALAEVAAGHAGSGREWIAVEGIRIAAFAALQNNSELIASIEASLATGCLSPIQTANYQELLDSARLRLASPPQ